MKRILFLLLLVTATATAQYTPSNQLNYIKLLKTPPAGTKADSVLVWNGTDKFVYMIPSSEIGGGDFIPRSGTTEGNPITGDLEMGIYGDNGNLYFNDGTYIHSFKFDDGSVFLESKEISTGDISSFSNSFGSANLFSENSLYKGITGNVLFNKQNDPLAYPQNQDVYDQFNAVNLGNYFYDNLAIKSTPSPDDEIVMLDSVTGEAVTATFSSFGGGGGSGTVTSVTGVSGETTVANGTTTPVIGIDPAYTTARDTYADGKVSTTITDGVTTSAPNQNAVFDALALKANLAGGNTFTGTQLMPVVGVGSTAPLSGVPFNVGNPNALVNVFPSVAIQSMGNNIQGVTMENTSTGSAAEMRFIAKANDASYLFFTQPGSANTATTFFGVPKNTGSFIMGSSNRNLYIGSYQAGTLNLGTNNTTGMTMSTSQVVSFVNSPIVPISTTNGQAVAFEQLGRAGNYSATGTATTTFTVTIGATQANTTYKVNATPTNALSAAMFYVTNKTTTTFDVVFLTGLTGAVSFDWSLKP